MIDLKSLTDEELLKLYEDTQTEISNYDVFQQNKKILLNSLYGSLANKHSRYFSLKNAEAITLTGQLAVTWVEYRMNELLAEFLGKKKDYVVAIDTDSCMVDLSKLVEDLKSRFNLNEVEQIVDYLAAIVDTKFNEFLDKSYRELNGIMNFYQHKLHMKREVIASRGFYTTKKRYALKVHDSEGVRYTKPKMKIMGLESERSSTPNYFRDKLKKSFEIILSEDNDSLISFINDVRDKMYKLPPEEIAFNRGVNGIEKYYICGRTLGESFKPHTPIHVRASICFNYLIQKYNLTDRYEPIKSGDKIKYIYLKTPNILGENIIAFQETLPLEFKLEKYLDYNRQFEKAFETPLQNVLDCFGWKTKKIRTLF